MRATRLRSTLPLLGVLAAALTVGGCAAMQGDPEPTYATLVVENDSPMTVNVYSLRTGQRLRIGQVFGLRTGEFSLRRSELGAGGDLQLLIDPIGSNRNYPSQSIIVYEGDIIELQVSNFIR